MPEFIPYEIQAIPSDFPIPSYWKRKNSPVDNPGSYIKVTGRQASNARLSYQIHSNTNGVINQDGINPSTLQDAYTNVQSPCAGWGVRAESLPLLPFPMYVEPIPQSVPVPSDGIVTMDLLQQAWQHMNRGLWGRTMVGGWPKPAPETPKKRKKSGMAEFIARTGG